MDELDDPKAVMTHFIHGWLSGLDGEPENAFLVQRYGISEAKEAALGAPDDVEGGVQLREWFTDRLTVDPGVPGPFGGLAADILTLALGLVDWEQISFTLRTDSRPA